MENRFESKSAAMEFLKSIDWLETIYDGREFQSRGTYCLAHGEYSRPKFYPARYKDGWAVKVEYFYYPGTCYAPNDGRLCDEEFWAWFLEH